MERLLGRDEDGSLNFDTMLLTSDHETVTRACLRERIKSLFADPADVALLYFSGHGTENDLGGYLVTTDADAYDEGVWLTEVLTYANRARHIAEIVIIVDSCHSGWLGAVPAADNTHASLREGLSILTASRASQVSMEEGENGVFTTLVCAALERRGRRHPRARHRRRGLRLRRPGARRLGPAPAVQVARRADALAAQGEAGGRRRRPAAPPRVVRRARRRASRCRPATSVRRSPTTPRPRPSSARCSAATA